MNSFGIMPVNFLNAAMNDDRERKPQKVANELMVYLAYAGCVAKRWKSLTRCSAM